MGTSSSSLATPSCRPIDLEDTLITAAGLPKPEGTPHVMYSEGVPVRIGWPQKIIKNI